MHINKLSPTTNTNTVKKAFIGKTPQATISFVTKAWGGRIFDKYLPDNCGMLDKLLSGDLVLADRPFVHC